MKNVLQVKQHERAFENTITLDKLKGRHVISHGGHVIGRIENVRINPLTFSLEGVVVRCESIGESVYIGKNYFKSLSYESIILKIELVLLLKGKTVINFNGKVIGKVIDVVRKGATNNLQGIIVKSLWSKPFTITRSAIKLVGKNIVLKSGYNAQKKYFWQKSI